MKIEDQVCTLEQAKKLKDFGVYQFSSFFIWDGFADKISLAARIGHEFKNPIAAAFTVAELGLMLPRYQESHRSEPLTGYWYCGEIEPESDDFVCDETQASTMAKRLIQLLENETIKVEEVNQRLNL